MAREPHRFTFDRCLGRGGFGEVYLAYQRRPGGLVRKVAVKVLRGDTEEEDLNAVKRMQDEGRMLAALDHPSIIGVLELTRIAGRLALVTEYVSGVDLASYTETGRLLPPRAVMGVVAGVAEALDCAWTTTSPETGAPLQLIHRDIKPQNIRISQHGEVKLLDFGIARTAQIYREAVTGAGEVPFTPGYSAPESYVEGESGAPADVYALGVTMFRLLTGERLLAGLPLSEQYMIMTRPERYQVLITDQLEALRAVLAGEEHDAIRGLLTAMLAWSPTERPDAAAVSSRAEALEDSLMGPTLKRWARSRTLAEEGDTIPGTLSGQTLPEDAIGETISVAPGVIPGGPPSLPPGGPPSLPPGGPPSLPPHVASQMSPELLAIAESALMSSGGSIPTPDAGLTSLSSVYASGTLPATAAPSPDTLERRKQAPGSSQSLIVNVIVALGIFVAVTVPMGTLVVLFFAWLNGN